MAQGYRSGSRFPVQRLPLEVAHWKARARLIKRRPDFRSQEGHLTYARAVAAEGDHAKASSEFETLIGYSGGYEPAMHYAELLHGWGEPVRARMVCDSALAKAKRLPAYVRRMNKVPLERLKQLAAQLAS